MEDRRAESPIYTEDSSMLVQIGKYWIHGILYSILMLIAIVPILAFLLILAIIIPLIGLIIGLIVMFLALGWINRMLAGFVWKIECRGNWKSLTGHGLGLLVALFVISIPLLFVQVLFYYDYVLYLIVSYGPVTIIQGIVAKYVASYFATSDTPVASVAFPSASRRTTRGPMSTCPYCNAVFPYREIDISLQGTAPCRTCGAIIQDPRRVQRGPKRDRHPRSTGFDPEPSRDQDDTMWG